MQKLSFQLQNKTALIRFDRRRIRSLRRMKYFALFLFVLSALSASATPTTVRHYKSSREAFEGPDRTITWRAWKEAAWRRVQSSNRRPLSWWASVGTLPG